MADVRDPERDQPLPRPGGIPVQEVMIRAIEERREYGRRKYGRVLETHNGRDALRDAWEGALDLFTYLTQVRLERGDELPGTTKANPGPGLKSLGQVLQELIPAHCPLCNHEPHVSGECRSSALSMPCSCGPR